MANAKCCDRCGSFYVCTGAKAKYAIVRTESRIKVDLCDKCSKELNKWMTKFNKEGANNEEDSQM